MSVSEETRWEFLDSFVIEYIYRLLTHGKKKPSVNQSVSLLASRCDSVSKTSMDVVIKVPM